MREINRYINDKLLFDLSTVVFFIYSSPVTERFPPVFI